VTTAFAIWEPEFGERAVTVRRYGVLGARAALPGKGKPTTSQLDHALETLGYTRQSPWEPAERGLSCEVRPIRRSGRAD
jgi:hypothetical protein